MRAVWCGGKLAHKWHSEPGLTEGHLKILVVFKGGTGQQVGIVVDGNTCLTQERVAQEKVDGHMTATRNFKIDGLAVLQEIDGLEGKHNRQLGGGMLRIRASFDNPREDDGRSRVSFYLYVFNNTGVALGKGKEEIQVANSEGSASVNHGGDVRAGAIIALLVTKLKPDMGEFAIDRNAEAGLGVL